MTEPTRLAHLGIDPAAHQGFVNPPVYRGSTVAFPNLAAMSSGSQRYEYGRLGNPTIAAFEEAISELEDAAGTVLCSSGLAACTTAILSLCGAGDHLLVTDSVYGPVRHFCDTAARRLGIETTYFDPSIGAGVATLFRPNTKAVFVESPGSYTLEIQDLPAIAEAAHAHDILIIADNSWATPLFLKPIALGADVSVMAATKYIGGHSDLLLGTIACAPTALQQVRQTHFEFGHFAGPDDVALAIRGLRTLDVRLARHQQNALEIATWLVARPEVKRVLYPPLTFHPGHAIWKRDFRGATGLLSFITHTDSIEAVAAMIDHLELFKIGFSWGGFESLVTTADLRTLRSAVLWKLGGQLVRLHIGLENSDDLIADLDRGFCRLRISEQSQISSEFE